MKRNCCAKLVRDEEGVAALEYGLIAALVATVIITAVQLVGTDVSKTFSKIGNAINTSP